MKENILTAEECYLKHTLCVMNHRDIKIAMIEFAKMHVREALKAAALEVENEIEKDFITKETVLLAYSLENIK